MSPLRFGFVSTMRGMAWGGSENLWSETALRLRQQRYQVVASVLQWPARPAALTELERCGVALAFRPRRRHYFGRALQKCLDRLSPGDLELPQRWWLDRSAPDLMVISQGGPWDGVPWMLACHSRGIPYCSIVHANSELWWPLDTRLDDIRTALTGAQRVFFVSQANRQLMERQCGLWLTNAEVIANPCHLDRSSAVPWPQEDGRLRIACVGRMAPNAKGQDLLLEVLAQPKWRQRPIALHLYGAGPSEQSVRALATHLGLSNVVFHGHVSDIRSIWAANHALVLPSRFEGLPLTIIEAMVCGRLVITTAVAGNTEYVKDGSNGFVAAAPTVSLLDDAMERAWARRSAWPDIGLKAREDALRCLPEDPVGDFCRKLLDLADPPRGSSLTRDRGAALPPQTATEPRSQGLSHAQTTNVTAP